MNIIQEDYVSFEVAKLLKEKGFECPVCNWYDNWGTIVERNVEPIEDYKFHRHLIACPTHQTACKWLREVHNLTIDVFHFSGWRVNIKSIPDDYLKADYSYPELKPSETYEEAVEAALKYTLENLI